MFECLFVPMVSIRMFVFVFVCILTRAIQRSCPRPINTEFLHLLPECSRTFHPVMPLGLQTACVAHILVLLILLKYGQLFPINLIIWRFTDIARDRVFDVPTMRRLMVRQMIEMCCMVAVPLLQVAQRGHRIVTATFHTDRWFAERQQRMELMRYTRIPCEWHFEFFGREMVRLCGWNSRCICSDRRFHIRKWW